MLADIGQQAVHPINLTVEISRFSDIQTSGDIVDVIAAKLHVDIRGDMHNRIIIKKMQVNKIGINNIGNDVVTRTVAMKIDN